MDNKKIFTEIIKRQIAILGPQITLSCVRNVPGIEVDDNGEVLSINGDTQVLLQELANQFMELSGLIVKKTMESILATSPNSNIAVGQEPKPQPINPQMTSSIHHDEESLKTTDTSNDNAGANRDIEELNKMLNNKSS